LENENELDIKGVNPIQSEGVSPEWPLVKVLIFAGSAFPISATMGDFHELAAWFVE
jgi:hypothetical protein